MTTGLLLLSGGAGRRMGAPKHALPHPDGGSWGGHLVRVFEAAFPAGPILVLGEPLPDRPELMHLDDPREGPAVALRAWAASGVGEADRWWVVACDQVRWTTERLLAWDRICWAADPGGALWIMALQGGSLQPLGSWFPTALRPALAATQERSLVRLATVLPHLALPSDGEEWLDVDTPEERRRFES